MNGSDLNNSARNHYFKREKRSTKRSDNTVDLKCKNVQRIKGHEEKPGTLQRTRGNCYSTLGVGSQLSLGLENGQSRKRVENAG